MTQSDTSDSDYVSINLRVLRENLPHLERGVPAMCVHLIKQDDGAYRLGMSGSTLTAGTRMKLSNEHCGVGRQWQ